MNQLVKHSHNFLQPTNLDEAIQFAEKISNSALVPTAYKGKPDDILCAIGYGAELNLSAFQSLQGVLVVNGKASLWGDTLIAMAIGHSECEDFKEWIEGEDDKRIAHCEINRKGKKTPFKKSFSIKDAKRATLWNKKGPWRDYPMVMLQQRATCFSIRRAFADTLKGFTTIEEVIDIPGNENVIDVGEQYPPLEVALTEETPPITKESQAEEVKEQDDLPITSGTEKTEQEKTEAMVDEFIDDVKDKSKDFISKKQQTEFVKLVTSTGLSKKAAIALLKTNKIKKSAEIPKDKFDHIRNEVVRIGKEMAKK
jgi:hypothetical protein